MDNQYALNKGNMTIAREIRRLFIYECIMSWGMESLVEITDMVRVLESSDFTFEIAD